MNNHCYFHENEVILNFTYSTVNSSAQLLDSPFFNTFLEKYLDYLETHRKDLRDFLYQGDSNREQVVTKIKGTLRLLLLIHTETVDIPYLELPEIMEEVISEGYRYWTSLERFSILYQQNADSFTTNAFMNLDHEINELARNFYRSVEAKITGRRDNVYKQLDAGSNASLLLQTYQWNCPKEYAQLQNIAFVHTIMVRTPLIIHTKSNKRSNVFQEHDHNPMEDFEGHIEDWVCYPALIGKLLIYAYFHKDYMASCVGTTGLFQLARREDCEGRKPDAILLFGNHDGTKDTVFYYDEQNDLFIGKTSSAEEIDYFGYTKKSLLTLHNLVAIKRGWLPIHGAMVNLYLKDGSKRGLLFMGDSGAGKSETLEALNTIASDIIDHQETVFDDMGSVHIDQYGHIKAEGTEIGAFVRLDDLEKGTAYKDLHRSIFFNPEKKNARVVVPAGNYKTITKGHDIDCFIYANNYTDKRGIHLFKTEQEAKQTFIDGKRFALGTTQESGLSTTFFANPFGPMQKQKACTKLINTIFDKLFEEKIPVGEVYTCLGLPNKGNHGIEEGAKAILDFIIQKNK